VNVLLKPGSGLKISSIIILLAIIILLSAPAEVEAGWQTLETENFLVHFPAELEEEARTAAGVAEEVHDDLIEYYHYEREDITHLIIRDDSDRAAGVTTPYLLDSIEINLSHPLNREFGTDFESWLRLLIAHEYAHVLHLNLRSGGSETIRNIFGRVPSYTYPNMFQPYWMLEGYAILAETMLTEGGRADDAVYDMYMRTAFLEDSLYELDQIHGQYNLESWPPGGSAVYIYGASIFSYLEEEYGKNKLIEVSELYAGNPGRGINSIFKEVYGDDAYQLIEDWRREKYDYYRSEAEKAADRGITYGERLTDVGFDVHQPLYLEEEDSIVYYHTGEKFPGLRIYDLEEGSDEHLTGGIMAPTGYDLTPGGDLIYSRLEYHTAEEQFYDLYLYDFSSNSSEQLTEGARAHSPAVTDEGDVIYINQEAGSTRVVRDGDILGGDGVSEEREVIIEGEEGEQFVNIELAPGGERLAVISWNPGGYQDLFLFDLSAEDVEGSRERITRGEESVISPAWSEAGDRILFSSDRGGIYNIYSYQLETGNIQQLTEKITGAFDPMPVDDRLIYAGYSEIGYNLYEMPQTDSIDREVDLWAEPAPLETDGLDFGGERDDVQGSAESYSALDYISPAYYFPSFFISTRGSYLGVTLGGRDPLDKFHYQATVEYDGSDFEYPWSYDLDLELDPNHIDLLLQSSRQAGRQMRGSNYYYQDQHSLQALYPLSTGMFSRWRLGVGAAYLRGELRDDGLQEIYQLFGMLDYAAQGGRDQFSWQRNVTLNAGTAYYDREHNLYSDLNWREFLKFPGDHRLSLRGALAWSELEEFYEMGGLFGRYPVRGYDRRFVGEQLYYMRGEYRYPFWKIKRGMGFSPVFFDEMSLGLFVEGGEISAGEQSRTLLGYGAELSLDMELSYGRMPARINLGLAGNVDESGLRVYIAPGLTF